MLTCTNCGNTKGWRNARQTADGTQSATCGACGTKVTSKGGVAMGEVTGGMRQER